jgi:hypothetical protein
MRHLSPLSMSFHLRQTLGAVLARGFAALFVTPQPNATIQASFAEYRHHSLAIVLEFSERSSGKRGTTSFSNYGLHRLILDLVHTQVHELVGENDGEILGATSGSCSIFPSTILNPVLILGGHSLEYILADGRFHDKQYHDKHLITDSCPLRELAKSSIVLPRVGAETLAPSSIGSHKSLIITARETPRGVCLRAIIEMSTKTIEINFLKLRLAYMSVTYATPCQHAPRNSRLSLDGTVVTTSVEKPLATRQRLSLVLTHGNPEAQFLSLWSCTRTLYQAQSCLNCAVAEAREKCFRLIISS